MGETALKRNIMTALNTQFGDNIFLFKVHGSAYMMNGLPDLIICYKGIYIGMELKMPGEEPTEIQKLRIRQIKAAGGICEVVRGVKQALDLVNQSHHPLHADS